MNEDRFLPEIVPACRSLDCGCDIADLMQVIQNLLLWSVYIATLVLVLLLVYVGFLYVTNPTNPSNRSKAKGVATSAIIGFVVVLGAFLIVDTVINTFAKDEYGDWKTFFSAPDSECTTTDGFLPGGEGVVVGGGEGDLTCPNCVSVEGASFQYKGPGEGCDLSRSAEEIENCQINSSLFNSLERLDGAFSGSWKVNELWPPTVEHQNSCHRNGTCVDAGPTDKSPASLAAFINAARGAGLYPVWEDQTIGSRTRCEDLLDEIEAAGGEGAAIQYGIRVSAHFSLYMGSGSRTGCFR